MSKKLLKSIAESDKTPLRLGEFEIPCYVLEDGTRVLSGRGIQKSLGVGSNKSGNYLTNFLSGYEIKENSIMDRLSNPLEFSRKGAGGSASKTYGFDATLLIDICDWLIQANRDGKLPKDQEFLAIQAEIIIRAVAKVGIIALVDEATGYQKQKDEYQKTLAMYIAEEMRPWVKTFKDEYYEQLYKLLDWDWLSFIAGKKNQPQVLGKITNELVYNKLPNGVIQELERINPKNEKGHRKNRHHQYLTESVGYRHLIEHLAKIDIVAKMYGKGDYKKFKQHFDSVVPDQRQDGQLSLDIPFSIEEYIGNQDKEDPIKEEDISKFNKNLKKGLDYDPKD